MEIENQETGESLFDQADAAQAAEEAESNDPEFAKLFDGEGDESETQTEEAQPLWEEDGETSQADEDADTGNADGTADEGENDTREDADDDKPTIKIKVFGEERELTLDEAKEAAEKYHGLQAKEAKYQQRYEEAAEHLDQATGVLDNFKTQDPERLFAIADALMQQFGKTSMDDVFSWYANQLVEYHNLSDEEKVRRQTLRENERIKRENEDLARKRDQAKEDADVEQYMASYSKAIPAALDQVELPTNEYTIRRMADLMQIMIEKGYEPDVKRCAARLRQEVGDAPLADVKKLPAEKILEENPEVEAAVRKKLIDESKLKKQNRTAKRDPNASAARLPNKRNMTKSELDEWRAQQGFI